MDDRNQVVELLDKTDHMVAVNGEDHYTNDMYKETKKNLTLKEEELKKLYEEKIQEFERELPHTYQQLGNTLWDQMKALKKSMEEKKGNEWLIKTRSKQSCGSWNTCVILKGSYVL